MTKPVKIGTFIILVNFLIYIGLGLPDAIMGSAWPAGCPSNIPRER